jgi:hypothetical protein
MSFCNGVPGLCGGGRAEYGGRESGLLGKLGILPLDVARSLYIFLSYGCLVLEKAYLCLGPGSYLALPSGQEAYLENLGRQA